MAGGGYGPSQRQGHTAGTGPYKVEGVWEGEVREGGVGRS